MASPRERRRFYVLCAVLTAWLVFLAVLAFRY